MRRGSLFWRDRYRRKQRIQHPHLVESKPPPFRYFGFLREETNSRVIASGITQAPIPPNSVVILAIANLASEVKYFNPGPVYSTSLSAATVFLFNSPRMPKMTSFPPIPRGGFPIRLILTTSGTAI